MYVNSMALRIAGIDRNTPDPQGGVIRRDEQGEPTGVLEETAVDLIWYKDELGFLGTRDEKIRGLKEATDYYAARGYTTANQGLVGDAEIMQEGEKQGYLGIRCTLWSAPEPAAKYAKENVKSEGNMFFMTGGKEFQDGSIGCGTAYLTKPYYTKLPDRSADYCGSPVWSREELTELVKRCTMRARRCTSTAMATRRSTMCSMLTSRRSLKIRVRTPAMSLFMRR